ncbi:MAG: hypothetical protein EON93_25445, partial [Burkholderiales bacterium]
SASGVASASVVARYGRCGGNGYTGATSCAEGSSCTVVNDCEYFLDGYYEIKLIVIA